MNNFNSFKIWEIKQPWTSIQIRQSFSHNFPTAVLPIISQFNAQPNWIFGTLLQIFVYYYTITPNFGCGTKYFSRDTCNILAH